LLKLIQVCSGKFIVYNNWDKSVAKKIDKKDFKIIDSITQTQVIDAQVASWWLVQI
jgi:hypothetical protein